MCDLIILVLLFCSSLLCCRGLLFGWHDCFLVFVIAVYSVVIAGSILGIANRIVFIVLVSFVFAF